MHRKVVFGTMLALLAAMLLVGAAAATGGPKVGDIQNHTPVTICHATASDSNPFTNPTVDESSIVGGSGHDGHDDIIPLFTYYVYEKVSDGLCTWGEWADNHGGDDERTRTDEVDVSAHTDWGNWNDGEAHGSGLVEEQYLDHPRHHYRHRHGTAVADTYKASHTEHRHKFCAPDVNDWVAHSYAGKNLASLYGWGATGAEVLANRCVIPEKPYVECDETVDQGWAYSGPAVDVGAPVWGDWVDDGDGTSSRVGTQATSWRQYQHTVDKYSEFVCSTAFRDEIGERAVREDTEPVLGCTDEAADNYDPLATLDGQSCEYPPVCEDSEALNVGQEGECVYPQPSPEPQGCQSDDYIWIWDLQDSVTGQWFHLRDLGYDGTYDSPGVDQQCAYFGCDFIASRVWGHWVSECDADYQYWFTLPRYSGGGKCPLPTGPSE